MNTILFAAAGGNPISEISEQFGVTWQLILTNPEGESRPFITPSLMFTGDNTGKAGEAMDFYVSVFKDAKRGMSAPYPPGASPEPAAKLMFAEFMLVKNSLVLCAPRIVVPS